jgi:hypothetical protein
MSNFTPTTFRPQNEDSTLDSLKRLSAQNCNRDSAVSLASAARTTTTSGANITVENAKGVILYLNITAASGTGGLHLGLSGVFPDGSLTQTVSYQATGLTATGRTMMIIYPGGGALCTPAGRVTGADYQLRIPPVIRPYVVHDDASSYTYTVEYQLLP